MYPRNLLYLGLLEDICNKIVFLFVSCRCFAFAELPWYQRKVAAVVFASPPTATYEEVKEMTHSHSRLHKHLKCSLV